MIRGFTSVGPWSVIYGEESDKTTFSLEGVLVAGRGTLIDVGVGKQQGTIVHGGYGTIKAEQNNGVIISGATQNNQESTLQNNIGVDSGTKSRLERIQTSVAGRGIFIRGVWVTHEEDNKVVIHETGPSLIQFSTDNAVEWATELKGHLKLTSECTIYDSSGTKIIENGKLVSK